MPARDDDVRFLTVDGRRWRRSDPSIPEALRKELVAELMDARRAVKAGAGDEAAVAAARARVDAAKRALGERGRPWWEEQSPDDVAARLRAVVMALARRRSPATICPSDAARVAGGEAWRTLMPAARAVARDLVREGTVEVLQKGRPLAADEEWVGPVRVRLLAEGT